MGRFESLHRIPIWLPVGIAIGYYVTALATGVPFESIDWNTRLAAMILICGYFLPLYGAGGIKLFASIALWLGWTMSLTVFFILFNFSLGIFGHILVLAGRKQADQPLPVLPFMALGLGVVTLPWTWLLKA